jgi:predicted RND superfamily exporter protein
MWSIGFGLEKLGLAAARRPVVFSVLMLLVSIFAAFQIPNVRFDGDVTAILPENNLAYRNYFNNRERFRDFGRDLTILVESDRLVTASGLEDLRYLQLELSVTPGVANTTTLFSVPLPDPATGEVGQFFPEEISSDDEARGLVDRLLKSYPQAASLVSPERNTAIILVTMTEDTADRAGGYGAYLRVKEAAAAAAPADFRLRYTGLTPIGATIVSGLISDQLRLTVIGLVLGAAIAFAVFRSLVAAVICGIAPTFTALWTIGMFGYFGTPINYLTTVLPTLALIVSYADGIMLYFRWQQNNSVSGDADANMVEALRTVGPASSLTSITTLLAFMSFLLASGAALHEFALLGAGAIALAFIAVIIGLPVAAHWATRLGAVRAGKVREPNFGNLGKRVYALVVVRPLAIALAGLVLTLLLSVVHFQVRPEYRITDYLPKASDVRQAEELSNEIFGGRSMLLVSVPKAEPGAVLSTPNRARLQEAEAVLSTVFSPERVTSLNRLTRGIDDPAAIERLAAQIEAAQSQSREGYVSRDGGSMLVTVRIPSDQSIAVTLEQINALEKGMSSLSYGKDVVVTGFDVLMAEEFTGLIQQLRWSLIGAIFMGVAIVGIATRSPLLALASITPNLLPILMVELVIWARGGGINISEVIALTIAFGIAIDNAVHLINIFSSERSKGAGVEASVDRAMTEAGPALFASMVIICVSSMVTLMSVLPMVPIVGGLIIATLITALVSNLVILPANILALKRFLPESATDQPGTEKSLQESKS